MKRNIKQSSDINGLEFFNSIENNFIFDKKKILYLEAISSPKFKLNPQALRLFKQE